MVRAAIASALLMLLLPATALAEPFDGPAEADYLTAIAYWDLEPTNCTSITKELVSEVVSPFGGTVAGAPGGAYFQTQGTGPCQIEVQTGLSPCLEKGVIYWAVGDLMGLEFSNIRAPCDEETAAEAPGFNAAEEARLLRIEARLARRELHRVQARCRHHHRPYCHRALAGIRAELRELP